MLLLASPAAAAGPLTNRCTNDEFGFSVSYPSDWYTNDSAEVLDSYVSACTLFAPFDDIVVYPDATNVPIFLKHQSSGVDGGTPVTIDGHQGTQVDSISGVDPHAWHTYYVPLDDETVFVAFAFDNGSAPFDESVEVLDAMMATVDLDGDGLPNVAMRRPDPWSFPPLQAIGGALMIVAASFAWMRRPRAPSSDRGFTR